MKIIAAASLVLAALAATPTVATAAPEGITPLFALTGSWAGKATLTTGAQATPITARLNCKKTSAAAGVLCKASFKGIPGMDSYAETDLFGFEPNSGKYHWFAVTNGGDVHDHVADSPKAGEPYDWVYAGTQEGKPFKEVITLAVAGKKLTFRSESFLDGKSISVFEGALDRK